MTTPKKIGPYLVAFSVLMLSLTMRFSYGQAPAGSPAIKRMQQVIAYYADKKSFMGSVLVYEHGNVLIHQGYGDANVEWAIPDSPTTEYRVGSITKQFTAVSILLLQDQGKLKIDAPIKTYLPEAPAAWDGITVYNLLTHTSGIPDFTHFSDFYSWNWKGETPLETIARFRDMPLEFEPGSKFSYSSSGFIILGQIIQNVSGMPYEDFLQKYILTPLEMKDTGMDHTSAILPQRAQGYDPAGNGIKHTDYISMVIPFSAGGMYSTTGDLLKWERGLYGGKILSPASLQKMTTAFHGDYGCGVFVRDEDGRKVITHDGSIEGFSAYMKYYPDSQLTIVVLSNLRNGTPRTIADSLGKLASGVAVALPSERTQVPVPAETLATYAGKYLSDGFELTITVEGDHLLSTTSNQRKVALYPESATRFFIKEADDAEIEFVRDADSHKVSRLVLYQDGVAHEVNKQ